MCPSCRLGHLRSTRNFYFLPTADTTHASVAVAFEEFQPLFLHEGGPRYLRASLAGHELSWVFSFLKFNFKFPVGHRLVVRRSVLQLLHDRTLEVLDATLPGVPGQTRRGEVVVVAGEV